MAHFLHISLAELETLAGDSSTYSNGPAQSTYRPPPLKFRYLGSQVMGHSWTCSFLSLCLAAQSKISQAELETDLSGQEGMSCLGLGDKMLVDGVTRTKTTAGCETPRVPGFWLNPHSLSFPVHTYFLSYLLDCTQYCTVTSMRISVFLLRVDADILLYVHVFSLSLVPPSPEELRLLRSHSEQVNQNETDATDET